MELAAQAPDRRRVFFSYSSDEVQFVARVYWHLDRSSGIEPFFFPVGDYPGNQQLHLADDFRTKLVNELHQSGVFILFCGRKFKEWQGKEVIYWLNRGDATPSPIIRINLFEKADVPKELKLEMGGSLCAIIPVSATVGSDGKLLLTEEHAFETARKICTSINVQWLPIGALPDGFMFNYEKTMISEYLEQNGRFSDEHVKMGCPMAWPSADKHPIERAISNPLTEADLGSFKDNQYIWVDARRRATINNRKRSASNNRVEDEMVFPAAGPHQNLYAGLEFLAQENIGILVSGGLAPGVNAVIDGIVSRYLVYRKGFGLGPDVSASSELTNIRGYMEGFRGLVSRIDPIQLNRFTPRIIKRARPKFSALA